jgi:PIN domain nuclease of toxin-antitoxin system
LRLLLDTHTLIWWLNDNARLGRSGYAAIEEGTNDILISAATAWEIATKHRLGKLPGVGRLADDLAGAIRAEGFEELAVTVAHGERAGRLPGPHRDPFDRMLIAQAQAEDLAIVSNEALFDRFGVRRVW